MINYFIFDKYSGEIFRTGTCLSEESFKEQEKFLTESESILEGSIILGLVYLDVENNTLNYLPPKPNDYSEFNWQTKQWEDKAEIAKGNVLSKRQQLLTATDWTDTVSASTRLENYNAWQFYRQQLRDITTQEGYPFNVTWPTQPV
jgi:hypothetical protein